MKQKLKKTFTTALFAALALPTSQVANADSPDFRCRPVLAGKALLTEPGFVVRRELGVASLAPEMRIPIEIVYKSNCEKSGAFGFAWRCPQLESSVKWSAGSLLWTTPWGEELRFYPKKQKTPKDSIKIDPIEAAKKGRGLFSPYSDWESDIDSSDYAKCRRFSIVGKNGMKGWRFEYADGRLSTVTTPFGAAAEFVRGEHGRLLAVAYDRAGRPTRVSDGCRTLSVAYAPSGFPSGIRDDFASVSFAYDRYNRLVATTDQYGVVTRRTYTDHGGVAKIERLDGREVLSSVVVAYDGSGRPVSVTDQDGRVRSCDRDALGRIVRETDANGSDVAYAYDALGRLAKVVDENGHEIAFSWDAFGVSSRLTAAGQLTSSKRGADGLVAEVSASVAGRVDRTIRREHDSFDRVTKVTYAKDEVETFSYDRRGRLSAHTRGKSKEVYRYDHFGRLVEKDEDGTVYAYAYDSYGRRVSRTIRFADGGEAMEERRSYDKYGRLVEIAAFGTSVKWRYDAKGRVSRQVVDGTPIDFAYTREGRLAAKFFGGRKDPMSVLEYEYSKDGRIMARTANGVRQEYEYDARGQLLAVKEGGADVERYVYDKAGNMLRKTVRGRTTTYAFDGANQLVSSTTDGVTTRYAYDAAGRLVREGGKTYRYGYLDKVLSVADGERKYTYDYHVDGQLARADYGNVGRAGGIQPAGSEKFLWDGLALVRRGDESFVNEPHVGGGNPVVSSKGVSFFNDLLGTTVGARDGRGKSWKKSVRKYTAAALTAFGVAAMPSQSAQTFFTGKPQIEGLGRVFLMRNYRSDIDRWQTFDSLGYADGWNQLAYCHGLATSAVDLLGGKTYVANEFWYDTVEDISKFLYHGYDAEVGLWYNLYQLQERVVHHYEHDIYEDASDWMSDLLNAISTTADYTTIMSTLVAGGSLIVAGISASLSTDMKCR